MNLRKAFSASRDSPSLNPLTEVRCFMWSWDVGESMVYAEAQKRKPAGGRLVHVRGEGRRGFGRWPPQSKTSGDPWSTPSTGLGMVRKWTLGSGVSSSTVSGDLGFLSWPPGKRVCGFRGQVTIVMPFEFWLKAPHRPKGPDKLGERRNCPLLLSQPQALPSEALVSYLMECFWQAEHRSVSLFLLDQECQSSSPLFSLDYASSPSLVNICSLSKNDPERNSYQTRHAF